MSYKVLSAMFAGVFKWQQRQQQQQSQLIKAVKVGAGDIRGKRLLLLLLLLFRPRHTVLFVPSTFIPPLFLSFHFLLTQTQAVWLVSLFALSFLSFFFIQQNNNRLVEQHSNTASIC